MMRGEAKTNPPYNSAQLNAEMNALVPRTSADTSTTGAPTLRNIAIVGALFDKNYNLYYRDTRIISGAFKLFHEANISMADEMNFHFYNLLAPIKSDFMAATLMDGHAPKADAVILCYLYGTRYGFITTDMLYQKQRDQAYDDFGQAYDDQFGKFQHNREIAVSPLQRGGQLWPRAAAVAEAKLVITYGGKQDEINSYDFLADNFYQAALHTEEKNSPADEYGVLVNNAHLADLQAEVNPDTFLGKRIHALRPQAPKPALPLSRELL